MKIRSTFNPQIDSTALKERADDIFDFNKLEDKQIWAAFKNGNDKALSYIYKVNIEPLYAFGHQYLRDSDKIKDYINDLFLYLKEKRTNLSDVISIKSYLYRSLYRLIMEKSRKKELLFFSNDLYSDGFKIKINAETTLIKEELIRERIHLMNVGLNKLSTKKRQAIIHYYIDGMSHEEVAYIMGLNSKDTARKLIYRGIESLKEKIASKLKYLLWPLVLLCLIG
ncbi:RNA polymerase sigma factor [Chondrinema litorale]|uniref:RNA polymerase sigma factor n=1 Tax=Chondrinema litorale TaxID=2994555 RepID=UPI002543AC60|nr:sigma-70 family RNA polymerase sigma factor [Chondrinema litorale]UZR97696.1 sigma-70 family RNA polymerase sigma factor [Chondrinema litorale]